MQYAYNIILYLEVALKTRKPTIAIYDNTFHLIGGGQKYGLTMANALKEMFDITIITNKKLTVENIGTWYNLDLSNCKIKNIPIPFYEKKNTTHLDPIFISKDIKNPFHIISKESGNYDFFINNSMNEMVYPLSNVSVMICHFPERRPTSYFYSDRYTYTIFNSKYTAEWIKKRWNFIPHKHIYPPADMFLSNKTTDKKNIILSVARFEIGGSKKQIEMIRSFNELRISYPEKLKGWKLILAGGSHKNNKYLNKLYDLVEDSGTSSIEIKINIPDNELKKLYKKSKIFWHLCGLNQTDPLLIEHFGMTIVEAMQNRLVPIVFDGGGQREIVIHKKSGFRVKNTAELIKYTTLLIDQPEILDNIRDNAFIQSDQFSIVRFEENVKNFFIELLEKYKI